MTELFYEPLHVVAQRIAARELSPVELTEAALARIERYEPLLNAFITVTPELALEMARAAEAEIGRGQYRGPLPGLCSTASRHPPAGNRTVSVVSCPGLLASSIRTSCASTMARQLLNSSPMPIRVLTTWRA